MHPIHTSDAPTPGGHYAQAVVHNGLVFVSGQLPIDPANTGQDPGAIEAQTERVLRNLEAILQASGSSLQLVLQVTVYIADITLWGRVNAVYARVFGDHRPARAVVPTALLHHGYLIEVQAVAALPG